MASKPKQQDDRATTINVLQDLQHSSGSLWTFAKILRRQLFLHGLGSAGQQRAEAAFVEALRLLSEELEALQK